MSEIPQETPKKPKKVKCSLEIEFELDRAAAAGRDVMYVLKKAIEKAMGVCAAELPEPRFTLQSANIRQERNFRARVRGGRNPVRKATPPETLQ